jgi:thiosulfate reductase cytochrome b subunit
MDEGPKPAAPPPVHVKRREWIYRHPLTVRLTHWINVLCVIVLLMSGMQIFNAHPALYWGEASDFDRPVMAMRAAQQGEPPRPIGQTVLFGRTWDTTGVLGLSRNEQGFLAPRGFPSWLTLPSYQDLATGRRWHFFFAWLFVINGLIYLLFTLGSGHAGRDLVPSRGQLRSVGRTIGDHLRLRFPRGPEARHYNVLQKLSYLAIVFVVLPVLVTAGLAMSPALNATFPWLPELFGGRQSARTFHFIAATLLTLFVLVHIVMVLLSGVWNNLRAMITGRYRIVVEEAANETPRRD